jgi:hypothetical protein
MIAISPDKVVFERNVFFSVGLLMIAAKSDVAKFETP